MTSWEFKAKQRREASKRFSELITSIYTQPGFHNFLHPPSVEELIATADPNPIIIINISSYHCDAFLIKHNQIRVLELPDLMSKEVQERVKNL